MPQITRDSLMTLEAYEKARAEFRGRVIAHKKHRTLHLGHHVTLIFEDELTMRYQIQEMLRVERIFDEDGIRGELEAYNPLIPDGANWKATMMIEYPDVEVRSRMLGQLIGIEKQVWVQVAGHGRVHAIADEDLERANEDKTAAVHFLRFELGAPMVRALKDGAALAVGVEHPRYTAAIDAVDSATRLSLINDLAG